MIEHRRRCRERRPGPDRCSLEWAGNRCTPPYRTGVAAAPKADICFSFWLLGQDTLSSFSATGQPERPCLHPSCPEAEPDSEDDEEEAVVFPESPLQRPTVLVAMLARNAAHALPHFLGCLERLDYPKSRMAIW
ncbi:Procollagen galactosyltransferase 2 [Tupaia chinensis]|uniref:Procollagen galactosyltransferase 2 n=1 Tax=Tupaia chinensis TaxID=246437 RepID=L9L3I5_TUPCH|nr:Procollagen galactosyltransferase 2 [Tupaia chinensis]